jgi:hypothetical protein
MIDFPIASSPLVRLVPIPASPPNRWERTQRRRNRSRREGIVAAALLTEPRAAEKNTGSKRRNREEFMGRRFVWQVVDSTAEPVAAVGEAVEYVEQQPRPGELALIELKPAGVAAIAELVGTSGRDLVVRDLRSRQERRIAGSAVLRASRVVGTRTRAGDFVRLARGWPV